MEQLAKQQSVTNYSSSDAASVNTTRHRDSQDKNSISELDTASVSSSSRDSQDKSPLPELAMDSRRQDESHSISSMLNTVDWLARHYSPSNRYHKPS